MDLKNIKSPQDIKHCSVEELYNLASQIRETIIGQVAKHGGHLASSLGVVELTLALHYVFNAPDDKIVWDVGHQAYVHKLLTGRFDRFETLRQQGGISGFLHFWIFEEERKRVRLLRCRTRDDLYFGSARLCGGP